MSSEQSNNNQKKNHSVLPFYSKADIAKHTDPKADAWISCNGLVFDVTKYMDKHPGGASLIAERLGQDVEEDMLNADHSPYAYQLMKDFAIGRVEGQTLKDAYEPKKEHMRGYKSEEVIDAVDFSKPTFWQVFSIADKYWPWLASRPVCHENRIFESNFFEAFSHWPWWYIWALWTPVAIYNTIVAAQATNYDMKWVVGALAFGAFSWSFAEYILHRFVFHMEVWSNLGNAFHYFAHGIHHLTPGDSSRLTFPPIFGVFLSVVVFSIWRVITPSCFDHHATWAGFLVGYLLYDTLHFFFHHSACDYPILRRMKSAHMNHHFKDDTMNFGVTNNFWDAVFRTYDPVENRMKKTS